MKIGQDGTERGFLTFEQMYLNLKVRCTNLEEELERINDRPVYRYIVNDLKEGRPILSLVKLEEAQEYVKRGHVVFPTYAGPALSEVPNE